MEAKMKLANPMQDQSLTQEERDAALRFGHTYQDMVRTGEDMFCQHCQSRGVPENIARLLMVQILLHRAGTNAAHELAELQADDMMVAAEVTALLDRLKTVIERQVPLSRETVERIGPRP